MDCNEISYKYPWSWEDESSLFCHQQVKLFTYPEKYLNINYIKLGMGIHCMQMMYPH